MRERVTGPAVGAAAGGGEAVASTASTGEAVASMSSMGEADQAGVEAVASGKPPDGAGEAGD